MARTRRLLIAASTAAAAMAVLAVAPPSQAASPSRHPLPNSKPRWLNQARTVGSTAKSSKVSFGLLLKTRNAAAAQAEVQALSDPSSASYGKYLSHAQYVAKYAPNASDVSAVRHWLRSQGFSIRGTLAGGLYVQASGSAAQVEKTFKTSLNKYTFKGKTVRANSTALSLPKATPAAVTGVISGVLGLDQGQALKTPDDAAPPPADGSRYGVYTQPCSNYFGQKVATTLPKAYGKKQPYAVCGYTPKQLQSAYGLTPLIRHGIDGHGVTIAITDAYASPTIAYDAAKYNRFYGLPAFRNGQFRQVTPGPNGYGLIDECGGNGWYGEETLDVEAVHTTAPGANIVYVGAPDCSTGLDEAWAETIDEHRADIITNSWSFGLDDLADIGQPEIDFYQEFSTEAALTGITVNFSSGDDGDHTAGGTDPSARTAEFPADLPYVTAVGGTSIFIGKNGQRLAEYGWQNAYSTLSSSGWSMPPAYGSGGGGGTSVLFKQPFYQRGVVPASVAKANGSTPMRAVPDIAMEGDANSGLIVGQTQVFPDGTYWDRYRIGGTSLSSPLMAGVDALVSQAADRPLGFANPFYYKLNRTKAVYDVVAPKHPFAQVRVDFNNFLDKSDGYLLRLATVDVQTSSLHSTPGWDNETGVGTPNGIAFVAALAYLKYQS
jgi:subtilase family serine protease